ncbi:MAG: AAA family ATPase, partial [Muribaculaceae bacterium]|nr:AAA family ATPase [Muribaculaceae bacterium]
MIESLHISNYALIDELDIDFERGFNIITGETGAGKSIMLGALSLLLGERADTKVVRDTGRKSVIEACFTVDDYAGLHEYISANELEWDETRCILRREISPNGRTRAFVNDSPVNLAQLRGVALLLVDIHSQHQNQLLATPEYQLSIIDHLADTSSTLAQYRHAYEDYRRCRRRLIEAREMIAKNTADAEYLRFQLDQLRRLDLQPDEQASLENERDMLA